MAKTIKLTAAVSCIAALTFALLYVQFGYGMLLTMAITFGTIGYHFCMRLLVGGIFSCTMKNRADYTKKWFSVGKAEMSIYKKLNVKKWKKFIPTYNSALFDAAAHSSEEIAGAMCQAELVHETIMLLSFVPVLASIWLGELPVFLITSVLAACLDGVFVAVQRYNRPRVIKMIQRRGGKQQ